ncbi:MAG: hypothetical protein AAGG11_14300 [Pseudomonadota bacterium]
MSPRVVFYNGPFRGLRITAGSDSRRGCSLDFLAFLNEKAKRRPATLSDMDPDLQQLLAYYREFFSAQAA